MVRRRFKVVICDDKRYMRQKYSKAVQEIEGAEVIEVNHPEYLLAVLVAHADAAVLLMDLEFPRLPDSKELVIIGQMYLPTIRERFPLLKIVIVTALGAASYEVILDSMRRKLHDDWIDVGKSTKPPEIKARVESLLFPLGRISQNGIWCVQMSDLHFGASAQYGLEGAAEDGALRHAVADDVRRVLKERGEVDGYPSIFFLGGDITDKARDQEFAKATGFIQEVRSEFRRGTGSEMEQPEFIIIPGNHDVNWDISRARAVWGEPIEFHEIRVDSEIPEELRYLERYMWAPFEEFIRGLGLRSPANGTFWRKEERFAGARWEFPEMGVRVFCGNSCFAGIDHFQKTAKVDFRCLRKLESEERAASRRAVLPHIVLVHHSLGSIGGEGDRVGDEDLRGLRASLSRMLNARIFLTGHIHEDVVELISVENQSLLFVGAGSTSSAKSQSGNSERGFHHYNIINIESMSAAQEVSRVEVFSRIFYRGAFRPSPDSPHQRYRWSDDTGWVREEV